MFSPHKQMLWQGLGENMATNIIDKHFEASLGDDYRQYTFESFKTCLILGKPSCAKSKSL